MTDFIREEVRDGFLIDKNRKALWKIELDIMQEIDRICKLHNIQYCVLGGALIGAIRHKGFIPWDDDIDVGMLREDFEQFLRFAPKEINERFFVQTAITDPDYYSVIVRIRDKNSTGILNGDCDKKINNGVFVELYPLDSVNPNRILYLIQHFQFKLLNSILYFSCNKKTDTLSQRVQYCFSKLVRIFFNKETLYNQLCRVVSKYNNRKFSYVDIIVTPYNCKYLYNDVKSTITVPFEYLQLSVPKGYDNCLKTTYGDYMTMPPKEKRVEHHKKVVYYDPYRPYTDPEVQKAAKEYFNN